MDEGCRSGGIVESHPFEHLPCGTLICRGGVSPLLKRTGGGVKTPSLSEWGRWEWVWPGAVLRWVIL